MPGYENAESQAFGSLEIRPYGLLVRLSDDLDLELAGIFAQCVLERVRALRPRFTVCCAARRFVDVRGFSALEDLARGCEEVGGHFLVAEPSWSLRHLEGLFGLPAGAQLYDKLGDAEARATTEV